MSKCLKVEKSGHAVGLGWIGVLCVVKMCSWKGRNEVIKCQKAEKLWYALDLWLSGEGEGEKGQKTNGRKDKRTEGRA